MSHVETFDCHAIRRQRHLGENFFQATKVLEASAPDTTTTRYLELCQSRVPVFGLSPPPTPRRPTEDVSHECNITLQRSGVTECTILRPMFF